MIFLRIALFVSACMLAAGAHAQIAFRAATQVGQASGAVTITHVGVGAPATGDANTCPNVVSPPMPNGLANDVLVVVVNSREDAATVSITAGTGWTLAFSRTYAGQDVQSFIYFKVATGTNTAADPLTLTQTGTCNSITAVASRFRGVDTVQPLETSPIPAGNFVEQNSDNIDTGTQVTTLDGSMLLVAAFLNDDRNVTEGAGWSQSHDTALNVRRDLGVSLHYMLQATAGSASISNWALGGTERNIGVIFALRPDRSSLTINVPAGTVANDVMIASITFRPCSNTSGAACTTSISAPLGWTPVNSFDQTTGAGTGGFGHRLFLYRRVAGGAEPASYTWTFGGNPAHAGTAGAILSFSGVDTANPIVAEAGQVTPNAASHATPTINTGSVTGTMLVSSHSANSAATWTPPAGMTERVDVPSQAVPNDLGLSLEVNTETFAGSGATGTRSATQSTPPANDTGATHILALRPAVTVAHYGISVAATTVPNCDFAEVTIVGHNASHAATNVPSGRTVTLTTSTGTGVWQAGLVSGTGTWLPSGLNNGTATYTWPGGESGFSVRLRQSAVTSLHVNLNDGFISEAATEDPTISFVNSAFRISNGSNAPLTIGTQIAAKPSNVAPGSQNLFLQAVRTDTATGACVSLFPSGSDVSIQVGAQCNNPASCGQNVTLTSSSPSSNSASFVPNGAYPASMNFRFTTANAEAPFTLSYADAGQITLQFRAALPSPPANQFVQGTSNAFVTRPFGFAFRGANATTAVTHGTDHNSAIFAAAGDNFTMTLGAYRWASGQDANFDGVPDAGVNIKDNGLTPNFAALSTVDVDPVLGNTAGAAGAMSRASGPATIAALEWSGGAATVTDWRYSEVGNVYLRARSDDYLGDANADIAGNSGNDGAASGYVGRFRPKHFAVSAPGLANRSALACGGSFSYMNEGLRLTFTLTAQNAQNGTTLNYTGANYAKLGLTTFGNWSLGARSGTTNLISRVDNAIAPAGSWSSGSAAVTIDTAIRRLLPVDNPDGPHAGVQFGIAPVDSDGVAMNTLDLDADNNSVNERKNLGVSTEVRFGRLRMEGVVGSETLQLPIRMETQYWNGNTFVRNADDGCSTVSRQNFSLGSYTGNLNACETMVSEAAVTFSGGLATVNLTAPGGANAGTVLVGLNLGAPSGSRCDAIGGAGPAATSATMSYLVGRWDDAANPDGNANTNYDDNPATRASFGLYGGQPNNFIYFRENY